MQTHKPSTLECKREAKATWAVGPHSNLTEWQQWQNEFSPHWIARQLFVSSLIFSLFRWCVGKEGSPLCQAAGLKSKVGSGCIWVVCEREGRVHNAQTAWIHVSLWYHALFHCSEVCWNHWRLNRKMTRLFSHLRSWCTHKHLHVLLLFQRWG